jgi:hypothetical protein
MALNPMDEAFMHRWTIPEEDRPKWQRWHSGYRWFRSANVIPLERYRHRKQQNDRQGLRGDVAAKIRSGDENASDDI